MPQRSDRSFLLGPDDAHVVYLLDAGTRFEEKLLLSWLGQEVGHGADPVRIRSSRRRRRGDETELCDVLGRSHPTYAIPLRVVWMAPENRRGRRTVSVSDLFKPGDPRDPYALRARFIRYLRPNRFRLVASRGALIEEMKADHQASQRVDSFESYVTRRAWRALDNAERRLQGNRYKIPRFVSESMLARREFQDAIDAVAKSSGMGQTVAHRKAERYLREIAATHSPYVIDIIAGLIKKLYRQGYGGIRYSDEEVKKVTDLGQDHPIVFLPSHRSNLDRLSLQFMLWENDLPANHTAGGINLNFFPVGPLIRRTGVFFIRRSFRDNELYKTVLRAYLDYLVEYRFPLEFYLEGGRSRSGKLLPPRLGMLSWLADSYRRGKADDIQLIPVSITYDLIQDVPDYAREAQGTAKESESVRWLIKAVRSLRHRYGNIYIAFGEPVSMAGHLDQAGELDDGSLDLKKIAFEVMHRIALATPITPTAFMSIALLAQRGQARSAAELGEVCARLVTFTKRSGLAMTEEFIFSDPAISSHILMGLAENGYVSMHEAVGRTVFWLDEDQMVRISYYRNMIIHYFVPRALTEMALRSLDETDTDLTVFNNAMLSLRDLLKFEFFFAEKDEFLVDVADDLARIFPDWETTFGKEGPASVMTAIGPPTAYWAVLPLLDAYQVVGDELETMTDAYDEGRFLKACLARARMYRIEGKVISGESASQVLFKSALRLAANRGLLEEADGVLIRRKEFAGEVRAARALAAVSN